MKYRPERQDAEASAPLFDGSQACAGADITLFFPPQGASSRKAVAAAKDICSSCLFLAPCLEYAMTAQGTSGIYLDGVWGHTTSAERKAIRRRRRQSDFFQEAA